MYALNARRITLVLVFGLSLLGPYAYGQYYPPVREVPRSLPTSPERLEELARAMWETWPSAQTIWREISANGYERNFDAERQAISEEYEHNKNIAHFHKNRRQEDLRHTRQLKDINENKAGRMTDNDKKLAIATENNRHTLAINKIIRAEELEFDEWQKKFTIMKENYPKKNYKTNPPYRYGTRSKKIELAAEANRYERIKAWLDDNIMALTTRSIETQKGIIAWGQNARDDMSVQLDNETEDYHIRLNHLEALRKLEAEEHGALNAAISSGVYEQKSRKLD